MVCGGLIPAAIGEPISPLIGRLPDSYRYANQLLPAVVSIAESMADAVILERKHPEYVALSKGRDEYVYHLQDKVFIRYIKDRYENPSGRVCGDFAIVRVELMDDDMRTIPPLMAWPMIYRNNEWQKLVRDEEGRYLWQNFKPIELPPYATRCFEDASSAGTR
jgi:hypothetical protein